MEILGYHSGPPESKTQGWGSNNLCFNLWVVLVYLKFENHGYRVCNTIDGAFKAFSRYQSEERSEEGVISRKNLTKLTQAQGALEKWETHLLPSLSSVFVLYGTSSLA